MKDLNKSSGIPISLTDNGAVEFHPPLIPRDSQNRTLGEMRPVLLEPESDNDKKIIYNVYRNVNLEEDGALLKKENVRYDITVIHPGLLGKEFAKTFGHYHENGCPEVFEVISGEALWLTQNYNESPQKIKQTILVEAREGEKAVMLPGFGHLSINPKKDKELVISNFVGTFSSYEYENYRKFRGGCYYILSENGSFKSVKNANYEEIPELIRARPKEIPELGIAWSRPLYSLTKNPEHLSFLSSPERFSNLLTFEKCYEIV